MLLAALAAAVVSPSHNKLSALHDRIQEHNKWPTVAKLTCLVYKAVCVFYLFLSLFVYAFRLSAVYVLSVCISLLVIYGRPT